MTTDSSFSQFSLHPRLLAAVEAFKLEQPTEVQSAVIPLALEGKDLQISAETGGGKTFAFLLPLFTQLMQPAKSKQGSRSLILVPTRELAQQVFKVCERLSKFTGIKPVLVMGGQETRFQASLLRKDPDVIVATPGRLLEHVSRGSADLASIEYLVLDEADRMLDMGFREDVMSILEKAGKERQSMLLSATLNHSGVSKIAREILRDPQIVDMAQGSYDHQNIKQQLVLSDGKENKRAQLFWLLENSSFDKAIIFCNKRTQVHELKSWLLYKKQKVGELHGEIRQDDRKKVMQAFAQGAFTILVASDVAARGLDIEGVELIINYDVPHGGDDYVHRVGRTGRAGNSGLAITFVTAPEWNLSASIQRFVGTRFERFEIPGLKASYSGPKKLKSSGKAAGTKTKSKTKAKPSAKRKQKLAKAAKERKGSGELAAKPKARLRDKKAIGKRRKASGLVDKSASMSDSEKSGMAPPKRTPKPD